MWSSDALSFRAHRDQCVIGQSSMSDPFLISGLFSSTGYTATHWQLVCTSRKYVHNRQIPAQNGAVPFQ